MKIVKVLTSRGAVDARLHGRLSNWAWHSARMSSSAYSKASPGCQACALGVVRTKCCTIGSASPRRPCSRRRQNICMP